MHVREKKVACPVRVASSHSPRKNKLMEFTGVREWESTACSCQTLDCLFLFFFLISLVFLSDDEVKLTWPPVFNAFIIFVDYLMGKWAKKVTVQLDSQVFECVNLPPSMVLIPKGNHSPPPFWHLQFPLLLYFSCTNPIIIIGDDQWQVNQPEMPSLFYCYSQ